MLRILAVLLLFMASHASAQQTTGPVQVANPPGILPSTAAATYVRLHDDNSLPISTTIVNPFGYGVNQTAIVASLGAANHCVMGGAQNGQGTGGIGAYPTIDSVAGCIANTAQPLLFTASGTYDATNFYPTTPLTSDQIAQLQVGTWILTDDATPYESYILSWAPDGTSVTTKGWWIQGVQGYQFPAGTSNAQFGALTKAWAQNSVVQLNVNSFATAGEGFELDVVNYKASNLSVDGFDAVQLGSYGNRRAFQARGVWVNDFIARGGTEAGFLYDPTLDSVPTSTIGGFASKQNTGWAFRVQPAGTGVATFGVDAATGNTSTGNVIVGGTNVRINPGGSSSAFVDFVNAGQVGSSNYNFRLINALNGWLQLYGLNTGNGTNQLLASFSGANTNSFLFSGAATGLPPLITASGDAAAPIQISGKTTGKTYLGASGTTGSPVVLKGALQDSSVTSVTLGATYTMPDNSDFLALLNTSTLAASTITLPNAPGDGFALTICSCQGRAVTSLTFSPSVSNWTNGSQLNTFGEIRLRYVNGGWVKVTMQ